MANIKVRRASLGATLSEATSKQFYSGPCVVEAISVDYAAAADAGTAITIYDGFSASGRTVYTSASINTDIGTTVSTPLISDVDLVAGTATADAGLGLLCADGVFVAVTLDVAGPQDITLWLRPLIKREGSLVLAGVAGSAAGETQIWQGPGLWRGYVIKLHDQPGTTMDIVFRDNITDAAPTVMTKTNYATLPATIRSVVSTTCTTDDGAAVTTAANANNNSGIYLRTGLRAVGAQGNAGVIKIEALFEA